MIFNMLMQIIVGIPLELSHGTIRVALLYLSGVFAASLTFSLAEPGLNLAGNYQGYFYTYMHWRHCNPGHRAMGRVGFLPRPEITYISTPFSLPRPEVIYIWAWLISAPNGVSVDYY